MNLENFPTRGNYGWIDVSWSEPLEVEAVVFEHLQKYLKNVLGATDGTIWVAGSDVMYGPPEVILTNEKGEKFYFTLVMEIGPRARSGMNGFYIVPKPAEPA